MFFELIGVFFIILCMGSILKDYVKGNRHYKLYALEAIIKEEKKGGFLKYARSAVSLFETLFLGGLLFMLFVWGYNEQTLIIRIIVFLMVYYMKRYMPFYSWIMYKQGIAGFGSHYVIEWDKIRGCRWIEKGTFLILVVEFTRKGIVAERADFIVDLTYRKQIERLINEKNLSFFS